MAENKKFVVKAIWNEDNSIIREDEFPTREKAEELRDLYDFGYECYYGKDQTEITVVIEEL